MVFEDLKELIEVEDSTGKGERGAGELTLLGVRKEKGKEVGRGTTPKEKRW